MNLFGVSFSLMDMSGPAILYAVIIAANVAMDVVAGKFGFSSRAQLAYAVNIALSAVVLLPALTVLSRKSATLAWALVLLPYARHIVSRFSASEGFTSAAAGDVGDSWFDDIKGVYTGAGVHEYRGAEQEQQAVGSI